MLREFINGDITASTNRSDIIIGMNDELADVTGIGLKFVRDSIPTRAIQLGSVISFDFDETRKLHMIICHRLGPNGWGGADRHVRFGLDYLDHLDRMDSPTGSGRNYSIVRIGTGRVGNRDGADHIAINSAMAASHLDMDMFIFYPPPRVSADVLAFRPPLTPFRAWSPTYGDEGPLRIAA